MAGVNWLFSRKACEGELWIKDCDSSTAAGVEVGDVDGVVADVRVNISDVQSEWRVPSEMDEVVVLSVTLRLPGGAKIPVDR